MPTPADAAQDQWCGLKVRRLTGAPFPMWMVRAGPEVQVRHLLSELELNRMARFRTQELRDRYASGHAALRLLVERMTGISAPDQRYSVDSLGKPRLIEQPHVRHNISHSGDRTLIGIDTTADIGVDLERFRRIEDASEIARDLFSRRERIALTRTNGRHRLADRRFLTVWTRKEACLKALGTGLQFPLRKLHCGAGSLVKHVCVDQHHIRNGVSDQIDGYLIAWAQMKGVGRP